MSSSATLLALNDQLMADKWPTGLAKTILDSKEVIATRFVIIDNRYGVVRPFVYVRCGPSHLICTVLVPFVRYNSRSMLKRDGHRLTTDAATGVQSFEECSRWQEIISTMEQLISHADVAGTPTEIRLLNRSTPVLIGDKDEGGWWAAFQQLGFGTSIAAARELLATEPLGLTPICKQIREVGERLRQLEGTLKTGGKVACLIIATDGESTDGNVVDVLKPLEGLPLKVRRRRVPSLPLPLAPTPRPCPAPSQTSRFLPCLFSDPRLRLRLRLRLHPQVVIRLCTDEAEVSEVRQGPPQPPPHPRPRALAQPKVF